MQVLSATDLCKTDDSSYRQIGVLVMARAKPKWFYLSSRAKVYHRKAIHQVIFEKGLSQKWDIHVPQKGIAVFGYGSFTGYHHVDLESDDIHLLKTRCAEPNNDEKVNTYGIKGGMHLSSDPTPGNHLCFGISTELNQWACYRMATRARIREPQASFLQLSEAPLQ